VVVQLDEDRGAGECGDGGGVEQDVFACLAVADDGGMTRGREGGGEICGGSEALELDAVL
jgi:hypothetical protein